MNHQMLLFLFVCLFTLLLSSLGDLMAAAQVVTVVLRNRESTGTDSGKAAQADLKPGGVQYCGKVLQQTLQTLQHKPQASQSHLVANRYLGTCLLLTAAQSM